MESVVWPPCWAWESLIQDILVSARTDIFIDWGSWTQTNLSRPLMSLVYHAGCQSIAQHHIVVETAREVWSSDALDAVCVISWILVIDWSRLTWVTIPRLPAELKEQSPWSSLTWIPPTAASNLTVFYLMLKWCSKPVLVSYSHAAHSNFFWQPCSKDRGKHYLTEITKPAICMLKP